MATHTVSNRIKIEFADEEIRSARWQRLLGKADLNESITAFSPELTKDLRSHLTAKTGVAMSGVPVSLDPLEARQLLMDQGLSPLAALGWMASFQSAITLRRTDMGEAFHRYYDHPGSFGSFLTKTHVEYRQEAADEFNLNSHITTNTGMLRQEVVARGQNLVIEGLINGSVDAVTVDETTPAGAADRHVVHNGPEIQSVIVAPFANLPQHWSYGHEHVMRSHTALVPVQVEDEDEEETLG